MKKLELPEDWKKKLVMTSSNTGFRYFDFCSKLHGATKEQSDQRLAQNYGEEIEPILNREGCFWVRGSFNWTEAGGRAWCRFRDDNQYQKWKIRHHLMPDLTRTEAKLLRELEQINSKLLSNYQRELLEKHKTFGPYRDLEMRLNGFKFRKAAKARIEAEKKKNETSKSSDSNS